jgi:hypothetical protein
MVKLKLNVFIFFNPNIKTRMTTDIQSEALVLNLAILEAHKKHYEGSPTGLLNETESPNGNIIYHLYSDGNITFQKGGWAYLQRSEFSAEPTIGGHRELRMQFPNEASYGLTYVVLTREECKYFRGKMIELLKKYP